MTLTLQALDLSPLDGELTSEDEAWLGRVQRYVVASRHVIRFGEAETQDDGEDYIVSRDRFGRWWAGRYIGDLSFEGRRLQIRPRLTEEVIAAWLGDVLNLVAIPETAAREQSDAFMARLMGAVWCRAVAEASRHGPPSFRRPHGHEGFYVRGRLDVRATARLRATGSPHVASIQSFRDLDNDVSRTLVAAERVLTGRIGNDHWVTPRVAEILPSLRGAVGARPRLPTHRALGRIRYTPITRPFKAAAELSWRLAQLQGYSAASEEGRSEGLLVDVAELWELFVLRAFERALRDLHIEHGTHAGQATWLLSSCTDPRAGLGRLKPDILAFAAGTPVVVADAKYKRLENWWPERPQGVDRADLYQLTSYLARYSPGGEAAGLLVYPRVEQQQELATAEAKGPWQLEAGSDVRFIRLPVWLEDAAGELRALLATVAMAGPSEA